MSTLQPRAARPSAASRITASEPPTTSSPNRGVMNAILPLLGMEGSGSGIDELPEGVEHHPAGVGQRKLLDPGVARLDETGPELGIAQHLPGRDGNGHRILGVEKTGATAHGSRPAGGRE